jgi:hypothetical protein
MFAVGVGVSVERSDDVGTWDTVVNKIIFRIPRPERLGIAWDIGARTEDALVSGSPYSSSVRMRRVLFGPGYTWRRGRIELTGTALVGPVFNRLTIANASGRCVRLRAPLVRLSTRRHVLDRSRTHRGNENSNRLTCSRKRNCQSPTEAACSALDTTPVARACRLTCRRVY